MQLFGAQPLDVTLLSALHYLCIVQLAFSNSARLSVTGDRFDVFHSVLCQAVP